MLETTNTTPAVSAGLVDYAAVIAHGINRGLASPRSFDNAGNHLKVWLDHEGAEAWVDSIHVETRTTKGAALDAYEIVVVTGTLPDLDVRVELRYADRAQGPRRLQVVQG